MQLLGLEVDDASKLGAVKGCTTNKATINVGHGHQLINGLRGDTSSVKDPHVIRSFLVIHVSNDRTARGVNTLCCLRGGNLSGSNGPNRLVWFREELKGKEGSKSVKGMKHAVLIRNGRYGRYFPWSNHSLAVHSVPIWQARYPSSDIHLLKAFN